MIQLSRCLDYLVVWAELISHHMVTMAIRTHRESESETSRRLKGGKGGVDSHICADLIIRPFEIKEGIEFE